MEWTSCDVTGTGWLEGYMGTYTDSLGLAGFAWIIRQEDGWRAAVNMQPFSTPFPTRAEAELHLNALVNLEY